MEVDLHVMCVCVGSRRQHARDKVKLQDLITELDQYVKDMDAGSKGHGREASGTSIKGHLSTLFT